MTVAHLVSHLLPVQPDGEASLLTARENMQRRKYLLLAGAAAGIAVNSNAPFTGVLYSAEIASNMLSTKGGGGGGGRSEVTAIKTASLLATVASAGGSTHLSSIIYFDLLSLFSACPAHAEQPLPRAAHQSAAGSALSVGQSRQGARVSGHRGDQR